MILRRLSALLAFVAALSAFVALAGLAGAASAVDPVTIQLAEQNGSGQTGTATLTDLGNGTTRVVVNLGNSPAGPQPIHVHRGTCANLTAAVRLPMTSLANGQSETVLQISLTELLAEPNAVNAHKSPQEAAIYVSCGDIKASVVPTQAPNTGAGTMPRTGGGGMARSSESSPLPWIVAAGLLVVALGAAGYVARRRA